MGYEVYNKKRDFRKIPEPNSGKATKKSSLAFRVLPQPMLAKLSKQVIDNPAWIYEMKIDGYRLICSVREGEVNMVSRTGKDFKQKYSALAEELKNVDDIVILDGEMVVENSHGMSDFQLLQNYGTTRQGDLKYYVFDILYLNGHDITGFPLLKRKELLAAFFEKYYFKNIINITYQVGNGKELFKELSARGYEGVMAKSPESLYFPGKRTDAWLKIKSSQMQEAVICGYTAPQKSRKYFGSLILGLYDNKKLKFIGNCGTGFNELSLRELHEKFEKLKTGISPFKTVPKLTGSKGKPTWLKPELVCNVKFLEWSDDGMMRAPVFHGLREDKEAVEVVNEEILTDETGISKKSRNMKGDDLKEKIITISGKKVKCTNITKVYWPGQGYTKGDLITYYRRVSKFILPYLKNRPQSLNRFPNGITGQSFYQKDMDVEQVPEWVKTVQLYSKSNDAPIDYLICNDEATLVYMANLGCIEINPWHSTWQKPDHPSYMMLDLDPGNISFVDVVNTALVIKEICDEIAIPCFCKTSGATGLHVYIPLGANYDYEQVKILAEIMANITHARLPSTTSVIRQVAKRKDKVYVDFLQNRKAQTIAAPYSVRPKPFATVSAPLRWEEVNHQLTPEMFTMANFPERLEKTGDLWQPVLGSGISLTKALKAIEKLG